MSEKTDVLQGTLDLMVLQTIETIGPQHGYGIAARLEQVSYDLTAAGRRQLAKEKQAWDQMVGIIHALLQGKA